MKMFQMFCALFVLFKAATAAATEIQMYATQRWEIKYLLWNSNECCTTVISKVKRLLLHKCIASPSSLATIAPVNIDLRLF